MGGKIGQAIVKSGKMVEEQKEEGEVLQKMVVELSRSCFPGDMRYATRGWGSSIIVSGALD